MVDFEVKFELTIFFQTQNLRCFDFVANLFQSTVYTVLLQLSHQWQHVNLLSSIDVIQDGYHRSWIGFGIIWIPLKSLHEFEFKNLEITNFKFFEKDEFKLY